MYTCERALWRTVFCALCACDAPGPACVAWRKPGSAPSVNGLDVCVVLEGSAAAALVGWGRVHGLGWVLGVHAAGLWCPGSICDKDVG